MRWIVFVCIAAAAARGQAAGPRPDPNFVNPLEKTRAQMNQDSDVLVIMEAIVVEGRIEKPQVMMTITKEKAKYLTDRLSVDFVQPVLKPLEDNTFLLEKLAKNQAPPEQK
jgi:hypothetical protein